MPLTLEFCEKDFTAAITKSFEPIQTLLKYVKKVSQEIVSLIMLIIIAMHAEKSQMEILELNVKITEM